MYSPGKLIFFDPFYYKSGGSDPKFFLVLKVVDGNVILASLPSSQIHLPSTIPIKNGCVEDPSIGVNCYIFEKSQPITKCGWSFNSDTMLYGNWIGDFELEQLNADYTIAGIDYRIIGELTDKEFSKVIKCFASSSVVKRRYKKMLA